MINVLTAMMLNILTGASQLGGAQRSGLTAIVSVNPCLSDFVRSTVDPDALMESGTSAGPFSPGLF